MGRPLWWQPSIEHPFGHCSRTSKPSGSTGSQKHVGPMRWVQHQPIEAFTPLAMAQPLKGMTPDSPDDESRPPVPAAWTRHYAGKDGKSMGRVFTSTYGASNDIESDGYRRLLINGCIWAVGLEDAIKPNLKIDFVGPFNGTWARGKGRRKAGTKPSDMAGWDSPIVPLQN